MSQKCKFCGMPIEANETYCPSCGQAVLPAEEASAPVSSRRAKDGASGRDARPANRRNPASRPAGRSGARSPQARRRSAQRRAGSGGRGAVPGKHALNRRQRAILLAALAGAAVLLIVLCAHLLRGGSSAPEYAFSGVLDTYFDSVRTADADKFISTRPPEYVTYLTTGSGGAYASPAVYRSETAATLEQRLDGYEAEYGDVRSIRYALTQITYYTHRCEALSDVLTAWYGFSSQSVSDAVIVSGTYTVQGTQATGEFEFADLLMIQIGDTWYFSPDAGSYWKAE